jgi:hypothetical protein
MPPRTRLKLANFSNHTGRIVGMPFEEFLNWFGEHWEPGQHIAIVAPTGEGKTTFAVPILKLRKWVMALDPKGMDDTLSASGFIRITQLPLSKKLLKEIEEGNPLRIIIGGSNRTDEEEAKLIALMHRALKDARQSGGWTVYADEFQILADRRMFGLDKPVEKMLIAARAARSSIITSFQAYAWVPRAALRQCRFAIIGPTRDRQMIKKVAEAMGRDWQELVLMVDRLPKFYWIIIPRDVTAPVILTSPPKLTQSKRNTAETIS